MKDSEIVELFWQRSEKAIEKLSKKHGKLIFTITQNILENTQDSEECQNDVYLKLWRLIPPKKPQNLKAFAGKVARNTALNRWQKNSAQKRGQAMTTLLSELEECIPSRNDNLQEDLNYRILVKQINQYLSTLEDQKQILFARRYWYGESIQKIAKDYKLSEQYIAGILFRVRQGLKDYLIKEGVYI